MKTKKKGTKYITTPKRIAWRAVFIGLARARVAARKAAIATGGVMLASRRNIRTVLDYRGDHWYGIRQGTVATDSFTY